MKRILIFLLTLTLTVCMFSCKGKDKDDKPDGTDDTSMKEDVSIVYADLDLEDIVSTLYSAIDEAIEGTPEIKNDKTAKKIFLFVPS